MCKYMGVRNYNYQIPREGSHIHGSRCNTWKHWETISQNKHCCHFWWFCPTVWKGNNNIKAIDLDLPFIYPISKKARTRSSTKLKMPLMKSIAEVQFKKGSSMLHYKKSFLEESYTTVIFLQSSFLKKDGLKTFPSPSTERRGITQSKPDNILNTLKGVPQSAHSFLNSIYWNNTSSDLCCSRDVLEEEEC